MVVDIVPSLEKVIGEQPPLLELGIEEAQNRFNYFFREFIAALPTKERPVVLFLDDLQRADIPSIKLVEMLHESAIAGLLIVCGYRDSEVDEAHPIAAMLREFKRANRPYEAIEVAPLSLSSTESLIADALYSEEKLVHPLAAVCHGKSGGNPFFLKQLLETFYESDWIFYDWESALWQWDLKKIELAPFSDNVAELMQKKISALEPKLSGLLKSAACIGNRFSFQLLEELSEEKGEELRMTLERLLAEELIIAEERRYYNAAYYRFSHDRIQEGAHALLDKERAVALHREVAIKLEVELKKGEKKNDELLFTIADHYNKALDLTGEVEGRGEDERRHIAGLNARAAKAAKDSAAYAVAVDYCEKSLKWFGSDDWERSYEFLIGLAVEAMESAYLAGDEAVMERYAELLLAKGRNILDSYRAYSIRGLNYLAKGEASKAAGQLILALDKLGFSFPKRPSQLRVGIDLAYTLGKLFTSGRSVEGLADLPEVSDRVAGAFVELCNDLITTLYICGESNLFALIAFKAFRLSLAFGNSSSVAGVYTPLGIILVDLGAVGLGYRFGKLTLALCDATKDSKSRTTGIMVARGIITPWVESLRKQPPLLLKNYAEALSVGNLQFASYSLVISLRYAFFADTSLLETIQRVEEYTKALYRLRNPEMNAVHRYFHTMLLELAIPGGRVSAKGFSEEGMDRSAKAISYNLEAMTSYLQRDFSRGMRAIKGFEANKEGLTGFYDNALFIFYKSLIHLALIESRPPLEKGVSMAAIEFGLMKYRLFARHNPGNFLNKLLLIKAEWARVLGKEGVADKLYNRSILYAKKNKFPLEEALAYELAGRFYFALEEEEERAGFYLKNAVSLYEIWGAKRKHELLIEEFKELFAAAGEGGEAAPKRGALETTYTETVKIGARHFDIESIQKSTEAISSTIVIDELLQKLMAIAMEQAGADRALLLTEREEDLFTIEAESSKKREGVAILRDRLATEEELPLSLVQQSARNEELIICDDAKEHPRFKKAPYIKEGEVKSILCMPLMNKDKVTAILYLENNLVKKAFTEERYTLLIFLSAQLAMSIDNARLYERSALLNEQLSQLNLSYERFVPQDFLALLGKVSVIDLLPGDQKEREMSALFMDIRSFTALSEAMTPQENFCFINEFIGYMEPVIRANRGFIDKYIGDAIMALFPGSADDAVICAVEMLKALEKYNILRARRSEKPIQIGIGINSGKMILGTVGNERRMDGTVISDAVNVASRVEHLTKEFGRPILFTEFTYELLENGKGLEILPIGEIAIRGKTNAVRLYTIG